MDQSSSNGNHNHRTRVKILVPQHVSALPPVGPSTFVLHVFHSHGVAWRGLFPLLMEAPPSITRRFVKLLLKSSRCPTMNYQEETTKYGEELRPWLLQRTIRLVNSPSVTLLLLPPTVSHPDTTTFASIVIRMEHLLLRLQTMTAWLSTLGGGYFFCRRLHVSLQLARQQRVLALQMGNIPMARQCSVNEAYNLIYAGKFQAAKRVLSELEQSIQVSVAKHGDEANGAVTLRQCQAARLLAKRLKKVKDRGLRGYHTYEKGEKHAIDDFQRIRIVVEDDVF